MLSSGQVPKLIHQHSSGNFLSTSNGEFILQFYKMFPLEEIGKRNTRNLCTSTHSFMSISNYLKIKSLTNVKSPSESNVLLVQNTEGLGVYLIIVPQTYFSLSHFDSPLFPTQ